MSGRGGIQILMAAETKAATTIQKARNDRGEKMKQAKKEADKQIEEYRVSKDREFTTYCENRYGSVKNTQELERQTKEDLAKLESDYKANKSKIINLLVDKVCNVEIEIPESYSKAL